MSRILGGELGWGSGTQADGMCVSTCAHGRPVSASQAGGVLFNMFGSSFCFDNMVNLSPNRYPLEESLPWKKGESRCTAASLSWPTKQIPGAHLSDLSAQPIFLSMSRLAT